MNKLLSLALFSIALSNTSLSFANNPMPMDSSCQAIAKACKTEGYSRGGDKKFWLDCMRPILLGQSVQGVKTDPAQVKTCRDNKIISLQQELKELQSVK